MISIIKWANSGDILFYEDYIVIRFGPYRLEIKELLNTRIVHPKNWNFEEWIQIEFLENGKMGIVYICDSAYLGLRMLLNNGNKKLKAKIDGYKLNDKPNK